MSQEKIARRSKEIGAAVGAAIGGAFSLLVLPEYFWVSVLICSTIAAVVCRFFPENKMPKRRRVPMAMFLLPLLFLMIPAQAEAQCEQSTFVSYTASSGGGFFARIRARRAGGFFARIRARRQAGQGLFVRMAARRGGFFARWRARRAEKRAERTQSRENGTNWFEPPAFSSDCPGGVCPTPFGSSLDCPGGICPTPLASNGKWF